MYYIENSYCYTTSINQNSALKLRMVSKKTNWQWKMDSAHRNCYSFGKSCFWSRPSRSLILDLDDLDIYVKNQVFVRRNQNVSQCWNEKRTSRRLQEASKQVQLSKCHWIERRLDWNTRMGDILRWIKIVWLVLDQAQRLYIATRVWRWLFWIWSQWTMVQHAYLGLDRLLLWRR